MSGTLLQSTERLSCPLLQCFKAYSGNNVSSLLKDAGTGNWRSKPSFQEVRQPEPSSKHKHSAHGSLRLLTSRSSSSSVCNQTACVEAAADESSQSPKHNKHHRVYICERKTGPVTPVCQKTKFPLRLWHPDSLARSSAVPRQISSATWAVPNSQTLTHETGVGHHL